jgi:hypothetical protein
MCDYSLHHVQSRPAKVGDKVVSSCFKHTSTRGFVGVGEPNVAVCLRPGTELAFDTEVSCGSHFGFLFSGRKLAHKVARFRHVNEDQPYAHHDALEFPDGETLLVTHLRAGQRATVLQLPISSIPATSETERARRPAVELSRA